MADDRRGYRAGSSHRPQESGARRPSPRGDERRSDRRGGYREARRHDEPDDPRDVSPSPDTLVRSDLFCPVAKRCGGCEWLAMPYEAQLDMKQRRIEELFGDTGVEVEPIIGMDDPRGFRNKVQLPFAPGRPDRNGRTTARWGIFERGSHRIVPCQECLVEDERARPIIATVAGMLPRFNIKPYDERTNTGFLRYALVRTALHTGQVMLTLVATSNRLPSAKTFVERLLAAHPEITTIVLNVNPERTSVILGRQERVLHGPGYIEDQICGCTFRISSSSFYQTNPIQAERLYDLAIEMAELSEGDRVGDAYCGTGTIGIAAAVRSGVRLLGVERNGDAVVDARANAEANGLETAEFVVGDAGSVFARMARAGEHLDVVFMDPPRAGSTTAFLANLAKLGPRRVVYVSCEPRTQRHDVSELMRFGYRVRRIRPVDMFPHTDHVENVILLERAPRR